MTKIVFQLLFNSVCYDLVIRIIIINKIVFNLDLIVHAIILALHY